jgi:predicted amidohydrolase YtcJ
MNNADLIVSGGTLVTMDGKRRVIENGAIAIRDGLIGAIGDRADI